MFMGLSCWDKTFHIFPAVLPIISTILQFPLCIKHDLSCPTDDIISTNIYNLLNESGDICPPKIVKSRSGKWSAIHDSCRPPRNHSRCLSCYPDRTYYSAHV
jgi:hypothetical protein